MTFAPFTPAEEGSSTVPVKEAVFTPCAETVAAQPSTNKNNNSPAKIDCQAVEAHTPCLRCMSPPVVAPENLPLPQAVAGMPAASHLKQLNIGLLLQYRVAFN